MDNMKIYIGFRKNKVAFVNESDISFKELTYSTGSFYSDGDDLIQSSTPIFRIKDIPAKCHIIIEDVDSFEEGKINYFNAKFIDSNDMLTEVPYLKKRDIFEADPFPGTAIIRNLEEINKEKYV